MVCDDFNLPLAQLRFRSKGSAGGQKGLADVIRVLGGEEVARLRIGIGGAPPGWDAADYVLGKFTRQEQSEIDETTVRAAEAVETWGRPRHAILHESIQLADTQRPGQKKTSGQLAKIPQPRQITS